MFPFLCTHFVYDFYDKLIWVETLYYTERAVIASSMSNIQYLEFYWLVCLCIAGVILFVRLHKKQTASNAFRNCIEVVCAVLISSTFHAQSVQPNDRNKQYRIQFLKRMVRGLDRIWNVTQMSTTKFFPQFYWHILYFNMLSLLSQWLWWGGGGREWGMKGVGWNDAELLTLGTKMSKGKPKNWRIDSKQRDEFRELRIKYDTRRQAKYERN